VDIYNLTCDGVGLATVADSFAAVEQRVVEERRLTWEELAQHLANDYAGAEHVRLMLKNIPRYGSGGSRADWWAKRISDLYTHLMRDTPTPRGFNVIPGLFSHGIVAQLGKNLGATPNGRHAHDPISHSADPDPGFMPDGGAAPTAKSNAVAAVQPGWGNSAPLQIDFDQPLAYEYGGLEAIEAFIKVHNAQGGTLVNINVVSKDKILEAHADPSMYPDLVVRVTGYSAYFQTLSPEYRQQVVDRILTRT
jgi:formate C-acetyltransferase